MNIVAYKSFAPLFTVLFFSFLGGILLYVTPLGKTYERKIYHAVFSVCWFMAGVAAVYANYLNDPFQAFSDAGRFFDLATGASSGRSLEELNIITEGAGAVVLWRSAYEIFSFFGLEKGRYVGILINVTSVAFSGVFAVKIARLVYGNDASRLNRLIILFSLCGLFWLFAAIHLRDGVVLLGVTTLTYVWTQYLARPKLRNLIMLVVGTIFAFGYFGFLRTEFLFVPLAMLFAGIAAILLFLKSHGSRKLIIYMIAAIGIIIFSGLYLNFQADISRTLFGGHDAYIKHASESASEGSLGMTLIMNQPIPLRLIFGSVYLYLSPIPFWAGFQLESAYNLFKSFNVLFFYFLIPLVALSFVQIVRYKAVRTPPLMFLLFLVVGFTLAIAGTSLESRHLASFLVPFFVLALLPELTLRKDRNAYEVFLFVFLSMIFALHIAWMFLKLL